MSLDHTILWCENRYIWYELTLNFNKNLCSIRDHTILWCENHTILSCENRYIWYELTLNFNKNLCSYQTNVDHTKVKLFWVWHVGSHYKVWFTLHLLIHIIMFGSHHIFVFTTEQYVTKNKCVSQQKCMFYLFFDDSHYQMCFTPCSCNHTKREFFTPKTYSSHPNSKDSHIDWTDSHQKYIYSNRNRIIHTVRHKFHTKPV